MMCNISRADKSGTQFPETCLLSILTKQAIEKCNFGFMPLRGENIKEEVTMLKRGRKLLEIYRALMLNPKVVLLDEPLSGLTAQESQVVLELVRSMRTAQLRSGRFCWSNIICPAFCRSRTGSWYWQKGRW
ncbi:MAG: hypothetical protein M1318_05325 [Firmicutes bacterium]|nr:hypothetical protein [Bacillota bacterium]